MNFIDLFSGIGGFRLGMERAGFTCKAYCEIDKYARKTYEVNFNTENETSWTDITKVTNKEIEDFGRKNKIDIICGGFPCQAFSVAGKKRGFEDTRGTMFFELARFINVLRPKYVLLENVKGLLNHEKGKTFAIILSAMAELGYDVEWQVLNSKDFEVPQNRERVFIIGYLRGKCGRKILPLGRAGGENPNKLKELTSGVSQGYRIYDPTGVSTTLASQAGGLGAKTGLYVVGNCSPSRGMGGNVYDSIGLSPTLTTGKGDGPKIVARATLTPDRIEKRQKGRRFKNEGEPMFTLTAQDRHGVLLDDGHVRIRRLTPLECFRLQGFPDKFCYRAKQAGISDTQLYKQAGNSVTVNVIHAIAKELHTSSIIDEFI